MPDEFSMLHLDGSGDDGDVTRLEELYDELAHADAEHGDVAVVNDRTEWCVSAHRTGRAVLVHLVTGAPRHLERADKATVVKLWSLLVHDQMAEIEKLPWTEGYQ